MKIFTKTQEETQNFAQKFAEGLKGGEIILLEGELGAGKTTFAEGIAKGLGIEQEVISPTFMLCCVYEGGRLPLYHFDLYRIESAEELSELGFEDYLYGKGVCVIEWNKFSSFYKPVTRIKLNYAEQGREIEIL